MATDPNSSSTENAGAADKHSPGLELPPSPLGQEKSDTTPSGRSFVDAVWDKFHGDMGVQNSGIDIYVPKKGPAKITDSGHLIVPCRLHMDDCGITDAGHPSDIASMCFGVTELDLMQNAICSWEEVFQVVRCMPQLIFLNLTHNPLISHASSIAKAATSLPALGDDVNPTNANLETPPPSNTCDIPAADPSSDSNSVVDSLGSDSNANVKLSSDDPGQAVTSCVVSSVGRDSGERLGKPNSLTLPNLRQLVLNDTRLEWSCIVELLKLFPNLEELHLSLNHYTTVDLPASLSFPTLERLFFNGNQVHSWCEINKLGAAFPSLQQLYLVETNLCTLGEGDSMVASFGSLEMLSLIKTQLRGWEEVEKLRLLPALTDVRLQGIPFLEELEEAQRRQLLVARLPNVTRLNGSRVGTEEREDAERAFIRHFMDCREKPDRYFELEEIYGKLDPLVNISLKPQTVFNINVIFGDRTEQMPINAKQTVRELKKMLQNFVGLPANKFTLYYKNKQDEFGASRMHYPDKMVYTYNLVDGDEFIIQPK